MAPYECFFFLFYFVSTSVAIVFSQFIAVIAGCFVIDAAAKSKTISRPAIFIINRETAVNNPSCRQRERVLGLPVFTDVLECYAEKRFFFFILVFDVNSPICETAVNF